RRHRRSKREWSSDMCYSHLIRHLSYTDAIKQLEIEFESEESLRTTIRQLFQKVPKVKSLNDHSAMKELHEAIDSVKTLAIEANLERETMALAFKKLNSALAHGFLDRCESKKLRDLSAYLKRKTKLLDWYNELMGDEASTRKDTSSKPDRTMQKKPLPLVSALYSDASESEDESDEIIIDAEIEGKPVP